MTGTKNIRCFVRDSSGDTLVELEKGKGAIPGSPNWRCLDMGCPIRLRSEGGLVDKGVAVRFANRDDIHGIVWCGALSKERE